VGCGLFLEVSAKQAAGIALIGFALSWLIGSLTLRSLAVAIAISVCALGLYVAVSPVWSDWNYAQKSTAAYDVAISDLQAAVKTARLSATLPADIPPPPPGFIGEISVTIPDSAVNWLRPEEPGPWEQFRVKEQRRFPQTMSDAEVMQDFESNLLLPRPTFHLASSVRAHAWRVIGGLALFASGLWLLGWMFRRPRIEQQGQCLHCQLLADDRKAKGIRRSNYWMH
jgi:hypothetical protein